MAARQNLCTNPSSKNDVTGYAYFSGGSTVAQATGLSGHPRTTGARFSSSGTPMTPSVPCTATKTYTLSFYAVSETSSDAVVDLYFLTNGSNTQGASVSIPFTVAGTVYRFSITRTVPSGQTSMRCLIDNFNASFTNLVISSVLYEEAGAVDTYFDGDTSGATWDGTNGSSTSTFAGGLSQALPIAADTSSAQTFGRRKSRAVSTVLDLSSAITLSGRKTRALPIAAETDASSTLGRRKSRTLGLAADTSSAQTFGRRKSLILPTAAELDAALALGGSVPTETGGSGPRATSSNPVGRHVDTSGSSRAAQSSNTGRAA